MRRASLLGNRENLSVNVQLGRLSQLLSDDWLKREALIKATKYLTGRLILEVPTHVGGGNVCDMGGPTAPKPGGVNPSELPDKSKAGKGFGNKPEV